MDKKPHTVLQEGWIDGVWREKNEVILLSARAAEHLVIGGQIVEGEPDPVREAAAKGKSLRLSALREADA